MGGVPSRPRASASEALSCVAPACRARPRSCVCVVARSFFFFARALSWRRPCLFFFFSSWRKPAHHTKPKARVRALPSSWQKVVVRARHGRRPGRKSAHRARHLVAICAGVPVRAYVRRPCRARASPRTGMQTPTTLGEKRHGPLTCTRVRPFFRSALLFPAPSRRRQRIAPRNTDRPAVERRQRRALVSGRREKTSPIKRDPRKRQDGRARENNKQKSGQKKVQRPWATTATIGMDRTPGRADHDDGRRCSPTAPWRASRL